MEEVLFVFCLLIGIALIVIFAMLLRILNVQGKQADRTDKFLQKLREEIYALHLTVYGKTKKEQADTTTVTPAPQEKRQPEKPVSSQHPATQVITPSRTVVTPTPAPTPTPAQPVRASAPVTAQQRSTPAQRPAVAPAAKRPTPSPVPPREPSAFEQKAAVILRQIWNWIIIGADHRSPDVSYEYAVATNWLLRISVVVFVVGMGFFIKYSIDRGWLGPEGRIAISVIVGLALIGGGLRLMGKKYHLIGQGLLGGGLATLYFSVFAAANMYDLINLYVAFGLMIVITFSAGFLAVQFNSLLAALLGIIGGYATPILLSTGEKNFPGLYGYLVLLGIGVVGIAWYKRWHLLNYLAMLGTYVLYFAAFSKFYTTGDFWQVFPFLLAFFVLFSSVNFVYYFARKQNVTLLEVLAMLVNAGILFGHGYYLVSGAYSREWVAALTIGLTIFYIGHIYLFLYRKLLDRTMLLTFLALASFFLTMTLPMLLTKEWLTVSWSVQALVMLWLATRLGSSFLRWLAFIVYGIVLFRLGILDLPGKFSGADVLQLSALPFGQYMLLLLERLVLFGVPIGSLGCAWWLLRREGEAAGEKIVSPENDIPAIVPGRSIAVIVFLVAAFLVFVYMQLEFNSFFSAFFPPFRLPSLTLIWIGLGSLLVMTLRKQAVYDIVIVAIAIVSAGLLIKFVALDIAEWKPVLIGQNYQVAYTGIPVLMRLIDFGAVIVFFTLVGRMAGGKAAAHYRFLAVMAAVIALILLFVYLTFETSSFLYAFLPGLRAGGVSIVWSLFALGLIGAGIRTDRRMIRYTGLVLFGIVVWKVFFSDLSRLDQLYRIIAFLVLGVLFLCGSLIYLKYNKKSPVAQNSSESESKE